MALAVRRKPWLILACAAFPVMAAMFAYLGYRCVTLRRYPVQGIDVSHHQGRIDWRKLPGQGVRFAYIKATEGGDYVDSGFADNWAGAKAAGIPRGAYHFFTLCRSGADQAANFIAHVPDDPEALPPVVDLEFIGNCRDRPKIVDVTTELRDYLDRVERHYRKRAVLYLLPDFEDAHAVSRTFDRPLWLRGLVTEPSYGARRWTIWQVSNLRRIDGIAGAVDWNVMREGR